VIIAPKNLIYLNLLNSNMLHTHSHTTRMISQTYTVWLVNKQNRLVCECQ